MSDTISGAATPVQTIPYGDRPIVDINSGAATFDHYQFLNRLRQGMVTTISNVNTIITNYNTLVVNVGSLEAEITEIQQEIATIQAEIDNLGSLGEGAPPAIPFVLPPTGPPLAPLPRPPGISAGQALAVTFFFS